MIINGALMKINVKKSAKRKNMEYLHSLLVFALFLLKQASPRSTLSLARARRRRISITAGEESEANVTCGFTARLHNVLEEGEHKQTVQIFHMFALFEDDLTIIL